MIYLDHNATTPLEPAVLEAMLPYLGECFGNPSSAHRLGSEARCAVEEAREKVAAAIGAEPREVIFTSGGTEANNLALAGDGRVITTAIEHASVLDALAAAGRDASVLDVGGEGRVTPEQVAAALDAGSTALVSIGWANNEIGTIQPIDALGELCRVRGVPLHSDAVQALGKLAIDFRHVDLLSLSAHKIGGPKGIGALCARTGLPLRAQMYGGSQERGRRAGTENVAGIVGFGVACELIAERLRAARTVERLREDLWLSIAGAPGVARNSPQRDCLPNTLNVSVQGRSGDSLVAGLDLSGIAVSTGSACAAGASEPSHVLRALGRSTSAARDAVRFSLGPRTTAAEIARAAEAFRALLAAELRGRA